MNLREIHHADHKQCLREVKIRGQQQFYTQYAKIILRVMGNEYIRGNHTHRFFSPLVLFQAGPAAEMFLRKTPAYVHAYIQARTRKMPP